MRNSSPAGPTSPLPQWPNPAALRRQRFALLFVFLLASILVYPYAETSTVGYYAFRVVSSAMVILTLYAAAVRRGIILFLLVLAVPSLLHRILLNPTYSSNPALIGRLLSLSFDIVVITIIFRNVYSESSPSTETIFGALCVYLLIGFAFSSVYGLILSVQPRAFFLDPSLNLHAVPDRFDLIFYSFGTMTELGTPGMTAISREVRSISILEAVLGILYLAVLISRLLGAYRGVATGLPVPGPESSARQPAAAASANLPTKIEEMSK